MSAADPSQLPFESLKRLLLELARERSVRAIANRLVGSLVSRKDVARARLWLVSPGDICDRCARRQDCLDRSACLHLAAEASQARPPAAPSDVRCPLGVDEGRIASERVGRRLERLDRGPFGVVDPEWVRDEQARSFGGQPIVDGDRVLGVLAVVTRVPLGDEGMAWLATLSDHAGAALDNARELERIERRGRRFELENADLRDEVRRFVERESRARAAEQDLSISGNGRVMTEAELRDLERDNLRVALERCGWRIYGPGGAAELLGLKPTTLASRIKKMKLKRRSGGGADGRAS